MPMPFIRRWKALQQRTGWPFEIWVTALAAVVLFVILGLAAVGLFHITGAPCK